MADVTLLRCLNLPRSDLEYSISQAVILDLNTSFDLKQFENFFDENFKVNFSIEVPVCFKCHQHLFNKPIKLTNCDCMICKDCMIKYAGNSPACPCCSQVTSNIEEIEKYCGEKFRTLCKGCYQTKPSNSFFKCTKGCTSCFDCIKKYASPDPLCPICSFPIDSKRKDLLVELGIIS